jgi:hypothetical protein
MRIRALRHRDLQQMQIGDIEPLPRRAPTSIRTVLKVRAAPPLPPLAGHDRLSNRTVLCQESHCRPHSG